MIKLAANLSMLFTELPFLDRFDAAARAGFDGVEFHFPYACAHEELAARVKTSGVTIALFNLPGGDWASGERGLACLPGRVDEFRAGVGHAVEYAQALGCTQVNCLAGVVPKDAEPVVVERTLIDNLRFAATQFKLVGIKLLLEAINTRDAPGFAINTTARALSVLDAVGSDNLYYQYDAYHMQRMEGELAATIAAHLPRIAHIQIADTPGRHEPGSGEINYPFLLDHIDRLGYRGWIGCEYLPANGTANGLGWARKYLSA